MVYQKFFSFYRETKFMMFSSETERRIVFCLKINERSRRFSFSTQIFVKEISWIRKDSFLSIVELD